MNTRHRRIGPAVRLALTRRPWIRWLAILLLAASAGTVVHAQMRSVEIARTAWSDQRIVHVATADLAPGDAVRSEPRSLPRAAVPPGAIDGIEPGSVSRRHVGVGEMITNADLASGAGPAATAERGLIVVAVGDPLLVDAMSQVSVGLRVQIHSEGLVLAEHATITAVDGGVLFVALDAADAPPVSAAAQQRRASIAFVP